MANDNNPGPEFTRRLYVRQTAEEALREQRLRQMFARMNEADKPKPPITKTMAEYYDLMKRAEARREARRAKREES